VLCTTVVHNDMHVYVNTSEIFMFRFFVCSFVVRHFVCSFGVTEVFCVFCFLAFVVLVLFHQYWLRD